MKKMRKFLSIVMAAAMALTMTLPASAAEVGNIIKSDAAKHSITINNDKTGHTYEAYQIFGGTLAYEVKAVDDSGNPTQTTPILSNITWGSAVSETDGASLITALNSGMANKFASCKTAEDVAYELAKPGTDAKLFAQTVEKWLSDNNKSATGSASAPDTQGKYVIDNLNPGYYLVKDQDKTTAPADGYTGFIMQVVDDVEATPKVGGVPEPEKKILEDDEKKVVGDYDIGDVVNFELSTVLTVENYDDYKSYTLNFDDTMSKGLDYNNDIEVKLYEKNDQGNYVEVPNVLTKTERDDNDNITTKGHYEIVVEKKTDGTTSIRVEFPDLKPYKDIFVKDRKIVITYSATLNKDAVTTEEGNINEVHLEYTNDPNDGSTTETPDKKVYVYTFDLDVTKVDDSTPGEPLAGAKFKLYKLVNGEKSYLIKSTDGKDAITWGTNGTEFTTLDDGKLVVHGLDAGTYYLEETAAPNGYNSLKHDLEIKIEPTYGNDGKMTKVKFTITKVDKDTHAAIAGETPIVIEQPGDNNAPISGKVEFNVENKKGAELPETGGMGTTIFTVGGASLMLLAVVLLVTKKKMANR